MATIPAYRGSFGTRSPGTGGGSDIFGSRVAPVAMPNPFGDLNAVYPNLSGTNAAVSSSILSKLRGELSPDTLSAIQDASARFGISSGMPGSGLAQNRSLRDVGRTSMDVQEEGLRDYAALIPTISGTQTVRPELQYERNLQNNVSAAAPNPTSAGEYAKKLFDQYLNSVGGSGGGGPAGGTGSYIDWTKPLSNNGFTSYGVGGSVPRYTWNR